MSAPFQPVTFLQWELVEPRGSGLHGQVYLARHRYTGDVFALKMMHLEDAGHASKVRRSLSTAKANYRIRHANVVTVHDLGCEEDGRVWVLMEWLEGRSVADQLALQRGRMSVPLALHICIEAAWGIDAAHEIGIVHRDIKPDNLWLTSDGRVKVLDFSLAKVIPEGIATTVQIGAMAGLGTIAYLAPEGLRPDAVVDARLDVYALGLVLWQLVAGRHPFEDSLRTTSELIRRQIYVDPEPLSTVAGLPAYVDEFMRRALAKNPDERFSTIAEMARAMMTLRDRLQADAEQGLFSVDVPPGEPPLPGKDPWTRRDYRAGHALPEHLKPQPAPAARVMVNDAAPEAARPAGPGGTQPLPPPRGFGGTQQLPPRRPLAVTEKLLAIAGPTMASPPNAPDAEGAPAPARRAAAGTTATPSPRETSPAVARDPGPRGSRARLPALLAVIALLSAAIATLFTRGWRIRSAPPPQATVATPSLPGSQAATAPEPPAYPVTPSAAPSPAPGPSVSASAPAPAATSRPVAPVGPPAEAASSTRTVLPVPVLRRPRPVLAPRPLPPPEPTPTTFHGPVFRSEP